jgi:outer membrane autotransporter protein
MKIVLLALLMSTASFFIAPAAVAAPGSGDNIFVEAKLGSATVSDWDGGTQDTSPELLAGYRWNTGFGKLGLEVGYAYFGRIDSDAPSNGFAEFGATINHAHMIKAGVDLNYTFAERLYVEPRIGLMRLSYTGVQRDFSGSGVSSHTNYDETRTGHYVGVGFGVWITPNFAVGLNYDDHTAEILGQTESINVFSIGVQYQF